MKTLKRHRFIVNGAVLQSIRGMCYNLYHESTSKVYDFCNKVGFLPYTRCNGCEAETPTLIGIDIEECCLCGGSKDKQETYKI